MLAPRAPAPVGTRAVIGGAFDTPLIFDAMREATGRSRPRIAVIMTSKGGRLKALRQYFRDDVKDGKPDPSMRNWLIGHGFDPIYIPLNVDNVDVWANDPNLAREIAACDAVYLAGGDQAKHVRCLLDAEGRDTRVLRAIRSVAEKGGLISGSSAGAAAQGGLQYGNGDVYRYLVEDRLIEKDVHAGTLYNEGAPDIGSLQRGLGILRDDVLVCTHFDQRKRLARLLVALKATGLPMKGIGVDEDTGLFVKGSAGKVVGSHGVFVADPSAAKYGEGPHFSVEGVRLDYLTHGDRIDLDSLEATSDKPSAPPRVEKTVSLDDILAPMQMTKLIEMMVRSGANRAIGTTKERDPQFVFELHADDRTRMYADGDRVSATGLIVNVRPRSPVPPLATTAIAPATCMWLPP